MEEARKLLGRLLDLSDAYKQRASKPEEAYAAVVAALDEESGEAFVYSKDTPFLRDGGSTWF